MTRLRHLTRTFAVIVKWCLNRFMTGLMSSGAACPAPPAADGNQPVRGWTTAAFRSDLNGAELVVSIPSKKKNRISGKHFKKNSSTEITRENNDCECSLDSQYNRVHCTSVLPCLVCFHLVPTYRFNWCYAQAAAVLTNPGQIAPKLTTWCISVVQRLQLAS